MTGGLKLIPIGVEWDGQAFRPVDAYSAELADQLPRGTRLEGHFTAVTGKADARAGNTRLYWAGINLLHENTDEFPTARKLHDHILEELGFFTRHPRIDGGERREIDSTKEMEDDEFATMWELAKTYVLARWRFDPWEKWKEEAAANAVARARAKQRLQDGR